MQVFINECSLNNQYEDIRSFIQSVKIFISSISLISTLKDEIEVFKSGSFFYYTGIRGTHLETSLKRNPEINRTFVENLQKINPKNWEQTYDLASTYVYEATNYTGTSVSEIAERCFSNSEIKRVLLNFTNSQFGENFKITIIKNGNNLIPVDCAYDPDSVNNWLIENEIIKPNEIYDEKSGLAPADVQTVLRDDSKFEKTNYPKNNGRTVFKRIDTNQLWVVESSKRHANEKAHIEVFDATTRRHLGTSLYDEINLNVEYKVKNRFITLT